MEDRQLDLQRYPLGCLDPTDGDAVRRYVQEEAAAEALASGGLASSLWVFFTDAQMVARLDGVFDRRQHAAALFERLGTLEGAVRTFRVGEVLVPPGPGEVLGGPRRAACVMERETGAGEGWWLSWSVFGSLAVGPAAWQEREGRGLLGLEEPFRSWLDPGDARVQIGTPQWEEPTVGHPEVRAAFGELPIPVPATPHGVADLVGQLIDGEIVARGLTCRLVFAFRKDSVERWEIRGRLPCGTDDLMRNIAAFSEPEALALVRPGVGRFEGLTCRAVFTLAERDGQRFERALPILVDPDGVVSPPVAHIRDRGEAGSSQWIGVEPVVDLGLHPLAPDGGPIAES